MKRSLSTGAIIIASVTFGILISADLGLMPKTNAQAVATIQTSSAPVTSVTIPSFADVASRVMPAVVSITTTEIVKTGDLRRNGAISPFDFFFPDPSQGNNNRRRGTVTPDDSDNERRQLSGGSGFIISPDGYILTNNHVVEGASKVEVHYGADENGNGGHTITAKIVGRDPATDLALLKIDSAAPLPSIPLGDSERIRKGDWAIAVGNPAQLENTLTVGVISAKGRSLGISAQTASFENFIQTDAAINFGNSGGPLLNINGEVVGINTAIRGGSQGLGFATPINTAKRLLPQLRQGKVVRGYLGMTISEITDRYQQAFGLSNDVHGAIVQSIEPGKPADKAGIQAGDVIVDIDGRAMRNNREIIDYISYVPIGTNVKIGLLRNGTHMNVTAKTAERPMDGEPATDSETPDAEPSRNKLGVSVQDLTPQLRQLYSIGDNVTGVVVTSVKDVSAAGEANIDEGDVISEVAGQKIANVDQFRRAVDSLKSGQYARVYVMSPSRNGRPFSSYRILQVP